MLFLERGEGHSKHWGSEEDWTWKHTQDQSKCKPRKAWNSIWVFSLHNICISIVKFICCLHPFSSGISHFFLTSLPLGGSHCSLGVHFYFTFSSQGLPTQMLTLAIFLQGLPLKSWQKSPWLHNSCIVNVCKSNITWIIPRFSISLKSSQTPLRHGWRREVWWNNILCFWETLMVPHKDHPILIKPNKY